MRETTQPAHVTGPFVVPTRNHCTACGAPLTAVLLLGYKDAVLCCGSCGRRAVFCQCGDPWKARA